MIVLIGMMGSGKSTVARLLGRRLGLIAIDLDRELERRAGLTINEIFARHGEAHFRALEEEALLRLSTTDKPMVLALGGGAVLSERGMQALRRRSRACVYLEASVGQLAARLKHSRTRRPLLPDEVNIHERLRELLAVRSPLYERYADFVVDTDNKLLTNVADEIYELLLAAKDRRGECP